MSHFDRVSGEVVRLGLTKIRLEADFWSPAGAQRAPLGTAQAGTTCSFGLDLVFVWGRARSEI